MWILTIEVWFILWILTIEIWFRNKNFNYWDVIQLVNFNHVRCDLIGEFEPFKVWENFNRVSCDSIDEF